MDTNAKNQHIIRAKKLSVLDLTLLYAQNYLYKCELSQKNPKLAIYKKNLKKIYHANRKEYCFLEGKQQFLTKT